MWHQKNQQTILSPQDWQNLSNFFSSDEQDVEWPKKPASFLASRSHTHLSQGHWANGFTAGCSRISHQHDQGLKFCILNHDDLDGDDLAWSPGLIIPRGICVSGHVVRGYVTEMHWPTRPGKTPLRDLASYDLLCVPYEDNKQSFTYIFLRWDQTTPSPYCRDCELNYLFCAVIINETLSTGLSCSVDF